MSVSYQYLLVHPTRRTVYNHTRCHVQDTLQALLPSFSANIYGNAMARSQHRNHKTLTRCCLNVGPASDSHRIHIVFSSYSHRIYIVFTTYLQHNHIVFKSNLYRILIVLSSHSHRILIVFTSYSYKIIIRLI